MKQLLSLITCSILAITGLQTHAQITILSTDLTSIGDVIARHTDTVPTYGPGNAGPNQTWDFSDAMIFAMVFPNMIGLYFLFPVVKKELNRYLTAIRTKS